MVLHPIESQLPLMANHNLSTPYPAVVGSLLFHQIPCLRYFWESLWHIGVSHRSTLFVPFYLSQPSETGSGFCRRLLNISWSVSQDSSPQEWDVCIHSIPNDNNPYKKRAHRDREKTTWRQVGRDWSDMATNQWMSGATEARNRQGRVLL